MFAEFVGIEIWKLDTIPEILNLGVQTTYIVVGPLALLLEQTSSTFDLGSFSNT